MIRATAREKHALDGTRLFARHRRDGGLNYYFFFANNYAPDPVAVVRAPFPLALLVVHGHAKQYRRRFPRVCLRERVECGAVARAGPEG